MTSAIPVAAHEPGEERPARPLTMFGPDFPFAYDDWLAHPAGLGEVPRPSTAPRWPSSAAACRASSPRTSS